MDPTFSLNFDRLGLLEGNWCERRENCSFNSFSAPFLER